MITLKNSELNVEIVEVGAEIRRVTKDGVERMWSGDPAYWGNVAPMLFPICSGLPGDRYTYNGKTYPMTKHGFTRRAVFAEEAHTETSATFLLTESEETLKTYPWKFELRVIYTLEGNRIKVQYKVKNRSAETMYYSIGSHEAYNCPEGIEAYDIVFEKAEPLAKWLLEGPVLSGKTCPVLEEGNVLHLDEKYFMDDAVIFKDHQSRKASVVHRESGRETLVEFPECPYLLLWHPVGAPFICIEPWEGICSTLGDSGDITEKEGIMPLAPDGERLHTHTIEYK